MRSLLIAIFAFVSLAQADYLPPRYLFSRYEAMAEHSPFAIKEPQAMDGVEIKGFATLPDGDFVIIGPTEDFDYGWFTMPDGWDDWQITGWRLFLRNNEPQGGFTLRRIEWDSEGCATIFLDKDGESLVVSP